MKYRNSMYVTKKIAISVQAFSKKLIEIVKLLSSTKSVILCLDESKGEESKVQ